jgi:small multidrug resistance family-3 protein
VKAMGDEAFYAKLYVTVFSLFVFAGACEIIGGWLIWQHVRVNKPWWYSIIGAVLLVGYGFIPTLQPLQDFGRVYAIYGGVFVVLSFLWAYLMDGFKLDKGDYIGGGIVIIGIAVMVFWPRQQP